MIPCYTQCDWGLPALNSNGQDGSDRLGKTTHSTYQTSGISELFLITTIKIHCRLFKSGTQKQNYHVYLISSEN